MKREGIFYFLLFIAVIASQYTKPGAKPTISGTQTPIAPAAPVMCFPSKLSYLNPSL